MKRRLLTIAIFLLAGAVVNVAVAWGCAAWIDVSDAITHPSLSSATAPRWGFRTFRRSGVTYILSFAFFEDTETWGEHFEVRTSDVPKWSRITTVPTPSELPHELADQLKRQRIEIASGWPANSMWDTLIDRASASRDGVSIPDRQSRVGFSRQRMLPLRPIWPGFAVNTLFYAAILWLLIPGPFVLRRFIRVRRGLCSRCAYPTGESDVCSECGKALPKRAVA